MQRLTHLVLQLTNEALGVEWQIQSPIVFLTFFLEIGRQILVRVAVTIGIGRSLADLIRLTQELKGRGVGFASLTEHIDTRSPTGKLVFHMFGALAEFERNLIRERTLAGLKAARARGRKGGRPKKLSQKELKTIRALLRSNEVPVKDIATQFGVNRSTLYRNMMSAA